MPGYNDLHSYQKVGEQFIYDNPSCALLLAMGLGKSVTTLTAIEYLTSSLQVLKPLIVAPKRVAEHTWSSELKKWDHLRYMSMSVIAGDQKNRIKQLHRACDIYVISRDNLVWLVDYCQRVLKKWPFDMVVLDELSSFKNRGSMRFKAIRKVLPHVARLVGLTATPASNGLLDLWPQMYLLDKGERLGRTLQSYTDQYFTVGARNGHIVFKYELKPGAEQKIHEKISDICLSMSAKDYLDLPPRIDIMEEIELANYDAYLNFKKHETLKLANGEDLTPLSAVSLYSKLLQFCNGCVYDDAKQMHIVDNSKLEALAEDVEALNGEPILVFYQFISDCQRILEKIPQAVKLETTEQIDAWNRGEIPVMIAHPASAGHGLNLQDGGYNLGWYGLPWDLELYLQAVGRLDRQGITRSVVNKHYVAKGTIEDLVWQRLQSKAFTQDTLLEALKHHLK